MSSFLRLECKQKLSSNAFWIRMFLLCSYSCGIETVNTFIHSRSSLENHTRFQTKMGKVNTCFQTKKDQKLYPMGRHTQLYGLYREVTPLGQYDRNSRVPMKVQAVCVTKRFKIVQLMMMMKSLPKVCIVWAKCNNVDSWKRFCVLYLLKSNDGFWI